MSAAHEATLTGSRAGWPLCLDVSPLDTGHRFRGVGSYVAGLTNAMSSSQLPVLRLHFTSRLSEHRTTKGQVFRAFRPPHRNRLHWLIQELLLSADVRSSGVRWFHATDFSGIPISEHFHTVATAYDLIPHIFQEQYLKPQPPDVRLAFRRMTQNYRQAAHLIAISEATKKDFVDILQIDPSRITVIPLGYDTATFHPDVLPPELQAVIRGKYFLYVGAHDFRKNIKVMLMAFARVKHKVEETLVLAGKKDEQQTRQLHKWIRELGLENRVLDLSFVPNHCLAGLFGSATAFMFCSLYEGFGLPALEAMACGCPVIASDRSSIPEVVGQSALIVNPDDAGDVAGALERIAHDSALRTRYRDEGLQRASLFTWDQCAAKTLTLYSDLLNRHS